MQQNTVTPTPQSTEITTNLPVSPVSFDKMGSLAQAIININIAENSQRIVAEHITKPFNVPTPKEKVRKRPDGFDYVEGSWMDHVAKDHMPLYNYKLEWIELAFGWVNIIISLTDRITGNTELGAGSARIQVNRGVDTPGFRDVIDLGNNTKAALTQAIKNAQSRFGVAADIYGKRESIPTEDERKRFQEAKIAINVISATKCKLFEEQWEQLGTDYSEFLDRWQVFIDRGQKSGSFTTTGDKASKGTREEKSDKKSII